MQIYVNLHAGKIQDGSRIRPYRTLLQAVQRALPGDEVVVMPGVYREQLILPRGGTGEDSRIRFRSFLPRGAVISGAEEVSGWEECAPGVYRAALPEAFEERSAVYLDGYPAKKAASLEELTEGPERFALIKENEKTFLAIRLRGRKPEQARIEISVRPNYVACGAENADHITLSGFILEKASDEILNTDASRDWLIEDCELRDGGNRGIRLGGEGHRVRNCEIHRCGAQGICASAAHCRIEGCAVHHIKEGACFLLEGGEDLQVEGCHLHHALTGLSANGTADFRVSGAVCHHHGQDIEGTAGAKGEAERCLLLSGVSVRAEGAFSLSHSLLTGRCDMIGGSGRVTDNILLGPVETENVRYAGNIGCGDGAVLHGQPEAQLLGDEGRWIFRTDVYTRMDGVRPLPGPFADGAPGAWVLSETLLSTSLSSDILIQNAENA